MPHCLAGIHILICIQTLSSIWLINISTHYGHVHRIVAHMQTEEREQRRRLVRRRLARVVRDWAPSAASAVRVRSASRWRSPPGTGCRGCPLRFRSPAAAVAEREATHRCCSRNACATAVAVVVNEPASKQIKIRF